MTSVNDVAHVVVSRVRVLAAENVKHGRAVTVTLEVASRDRGALERALAHCRVVYEGEPEDFEARIACTIVSDALMELPD